MFLGRCTDELFVVLKHYSLVQFTLSYAFHNLYVVQIPVNCIQYRLPSVTDACIHLYLSGYVH